MKRLWREDSLAYNRIDQSREIKYIVIDILDRFEWTNFV